VACHTAALTPDTFATGMGHSLPGRASSKFGNVRYAAESGKQIQSISGPTGDRALRTEVIFE
jgi:hypothetical protein